MKTMLNPRWLKFASLKITLALIPLVLAGSMLAAQSTEMGRPTQLTSREFSADFERNVTHYYSFEAGPGELTFLIGAQSIDGSAYVQWRIYDVNLKEVNGFGYFQTGNNEEQKIDRFTLKKKEKILITVVCQRVTSRGGKYHFRLSGAVDLPESSNK